MPSIPDFSNTIDIWIKDLERKTFAQLCARPSPQSWSLGQVGMHLIEATNFYLEQATICMSADDHATEQMAPHGRIMFHRNEFPDEIIEGPPSNAGTPQPRRKNQLMSELMTLRDRINDVGNRIAKNPSAGKTKHPGLSYLNADEWFQFAEMHLRHHLRQKRRIEEFLKLDDINGRYKFR
jgi:hypothetical protein